MAVSGEPVGGSSGEWIGFSLAALHYRHNIAFHHSASPCILLVSRVTVRTARQRLGLGTARMTVDSLAVNTQGVVRVPTFVIAQKVTMERSDTGYFQRTVPLFGYREAELSYVRIVSTVTRQPNRFPLALSGYRAAAGAPQSPAPLLGDCSPHRTGQAGRRLHCCATAVHRLQPAPESAAVVCRMQQASTTLAGSGCRKGGSRTVRRGHAGDMQHSRERVRQTCRSRRAWRVGC
jgi:hypothetical protein